MADVGPPLRPIASHAGDGSPVPSEYGDGRSQISVEPDRAEARESAPKRRHVNLERAHRTVVPPGEGRLGAPRSGSA